MIGRAADSSYHQMRFLRTPEAPQRARAAVRDYLVGVARETIDKVTLLASELVSNSVRHSDAGAFPEVLMSVLRTDGRIRVEVADGGDGFKYQPRSGSAEKVGGWGLYLVDRISDRWGIEKGSPTVVWFECQQGEAQDSDVPLSQ